MNQHGIEKTAMPSISLAGENFDCIRCFCPADWIGDKDDAIPLTPFSLEPVQPNNEFHILPHRIVLVTTDLEYRRPLEEAECAGDDEESVDRLP